MILSLKDKSHEEQGFLKWRLWYSKKVLYLYGIFKEADALDHYRVRINDLNVNFLRNEQSLNIIELAQYLNELL